MIASYKDRETEMIAHGMYSARFSREIQMKAKARLDLLNAIGSLNDLRKPASLRFKRLRGDRLDQYSIRVNNQFRICFGWIEGRVTNVELTDYY